jgi:hypothetical protein
MNQAAGSVIRILVKFAVIALAVWLIVFASGCASRSQEEKNEQAEATTEMQASGTIKATGTIGIPIPGSNPPSSFPAPFEVTFERQETSKATTASDSVSKTKSETHIDGAEIGKQVGAAVTASIRQAFPAMSAIVPSPGHAWGEILAGAASALVPAAGYALSQRNVAKLHEKRADEHKADADDAWAKLQEINKA